MNRVDRIAQPLRFFATRALALVAAALVLAACGDAGTGARSHARAADRETREDGALDAMREFLARRVPPGASEIPTERLRAAALAREAMPRHRAPRGAVDAKAIAAAAWQALGPTDASGRMRTLAFDPRNPDHLYGGGVSGGLWTSTDAGLSWRALSDQTVNLDIGALAIDPAHPDTLYVGTGELYRNSGLPWSPMRGAGMLKSTDGGATWTQLVSTARDEFRYVSDIVLSPHDPARLYVATNSGIWRSRDGGTTFEQVLFPADGGAARYEGCNDLAIRSDKPGDWLLAACASRSTADRYYLPNTVLPPACAGPCPAAIFLNTDAAGGGTWASVLSEAGQGRTQMDVHRADQDVVYAAAASIVPGFDRNGDGVGDYDNGLHAVFRSDDGGQTWHATVRNSAPVALNSYLFSYADQFDPAFCGDLVDPPFIYGAGWYNNAIAVDPIDPNVVWVAGMDVYRSDDGGRNFGMATHWWFDVSEPEYIHADVHLLAFDPRFDGATHQRLYATTDGGLYATDTARASVDVGPAAACGVTTGRMAWRPRGAGMATLQFYSGAVLPNARGYLGGAQDNGTWLGSDASGAGGWRHVFGGDGGNVAFDPRNPSVLYVSYQYVSIQKSTDGGNSFRPATSGLDDQTLFIMPYGLDPNAPDRLFAVGSRLWRSDDGAAHWHAASAPFAGIGVDRLGSAFAVAPGRPDRMLIGNRQAILRSDAALASGPGTSWASASPRSGWVSSLTFDSANVDVAYATYSTYGGVHVWKSVDGGGSWQPLDGSGPGTLPDLPVHALAIDPADHAHLFVGTDLGLFVSFDGGASWAADDAGFADVIVQALAVDASVATPMLYAFTYGRGAWRAPFASFAAGNVARREGREVIYGPNGAPTIVPIGPPRALREPPRSGARN